MCGVKMLDEDESHAGIGRKISHQLPDRFYASSRSSNGNNGGVRLKLSRSGGGRLSELLPNFFTHRFRAHDFPPVFGADLPASRNGWRLPKSRRSITR